MAEIEIEIDGKSLTAKPNQTVIQVADDAGIYIPRFCYHKKLSIPANCRMCLVEVEKAPKVLPACATPVMPGMKVFTKSKKTIDAQRAVMEFLLINHPLDCPICDQGGECELQDLSMGYGSGWSHYKESKRAVFDQDLGPLIATDMTRCIACTRCVRFGEEVAGMRELGAMYRGEGTAISTYIKHAMQSEVSGNIIDICPVGALTSKPFRFRARAFELDQAPSISPHDCVGSHLSIHTRYGKVMRVVSREAATLNETWIADRDRFSYTGLYHPDRLEEPIIKENGVWQVVDWHQAFESVTARLNEALCEFGADKLGALASPNATLEEFYLLQKIVRGLGSPHVDHRLREMNTQDQAEMGAYPGLTMRLSELETCDVILLVGSNLPKEQPMVALRVRKARERGAIVLVVNPVDYHFNFKVDEKKIISPQEMVNTLALLADALSDDHLQSIHPDDQDHALHSMARSLKTQQKACILLGALALHDKEAPAIRALAGSIAEQTGATLGMMTDGCNSAGAWLSGAIPHRHAGGEPINHVGLNAYEMLSKPRKAYVLLNVEPDFDCANPSMARSAFKQAKCVIALSMYRNKALEDYAHVVLPIAPFTETSGTFINAWGDWQSFNTVAAPFAKSRPAWKVLRVLGNTLNLEGFDYESSHAVKHEIKDKIEKASPILAQKRERAVARLPKKEKQLMRIGEVPIYVGDSLVRRAEPLQAAQSIMEGDVDVVRMHPETASHHHLLEGDTVRVKQENDHIDLPLVIDEKIAKDAAWIAGGIGKTRELGDLFGEVVIEKV